MKLTAEITLYPLQDYYLDIIKATIDKINTYPNVEVSTVPTATILVGEYADVMVVINDIVAWSFETYGKCVFVTKFIPGYNAFE